MKTTNQSLSRALLILLVGTMSIFAIACGGSRGTASSSTTGANTNAPTVTSAPPPTVASRTCDSGSLWESARKQLGIAADDPRLSAGNSQFGNVLGFQCVDDWALGAVIRDTNPICDCADLFHWTGSEWSYLGNMWPTTDCALLAKGVPGSVITQWNSGAWEIDLTCGNQNTPSEVQARIDRYNQLDAQCRGSIDPASTGNSCIERNSTRIELDHLDWCYGRESDASAAAARWHRCVADSIHPQGL